MKNASCSLILISAVFLSSTLGERAFAYSSDTATGLYALQSDSDSPDDNTADGYYALFGNRPGYVGNSGFGAYALYDNDTGIENTAVGAGALEFGNGSQNTSVGFESLYLSNIGSLNTAVGYQALYSNTQGFSNTAIGSSALYSNGFGKYNTASGYQTLQFNDAGSANVADGSQALSQNTEGNGNTATGAIALENNQTGNNNTADGYAALQGNSGNNNVALGYQAGVNVRAGSNNIELGNSGLTTDNNTIRLGAKGTQTKTFIAGIYGMTAASGVPVYVAANGQLGTLTSSAKFKQNIHDMGQASDALMALRPVTFQYKPDIDPAGTPQFGLIAEEVEKVDPELVVHDEDHQLYSVRYEAVNAMLLNEFQKQHETIVAQQKFVDDQMKINAEQQKTISDQQKMLQSLAARLDQIEQAKGK